MTMTDLPATAQTQQAESGYAGAVSDLRVAAVLEVLAGTAAVEVARRWAVDEDVLRRWVAAFVEAGTARVTNVPTGDDARRRDRFLAAFAHEVRTPLAVAQGWVRLLHEGAVRPDAVPEAIERLQQALGRLAERTLDVELLAAASLGRVTPMLQPVRIGELTGELTGLAGVHGLGPDVVVEVDPALFRRILRDLWDAACVAPAPRTQFLEVLRTGPWLEVRVVREGHPIDPQVLQAMFEPFDRNDDATGVTMGLYLARALTVLHGGSVGIEQDDARAMLWVRVPAHS